jgi:hypothetical protein
MAPIGRPFCPEKSFRGPLSSVEQSIYHYAVRLQNGWPTPFETDYRSGL